MRKILFRGKRKTNGEWIIGGIYIDDGKYYIVRSEKYIPDTRDWDEAEYYENNPVYKMTTFEVIPETVGQFTGLTDSKGTKIFEGDIIQENWSKVFASKENHLVRWEDGSCGFEPLSDSIHNCGHCGGALNPEWVEVVGNIHDNPELAEVSK